MKRGLLWFEGGFDKRRYQCSSALVPGSKSRKTTNLPGPFPVQSSYGVMTSQRPFFLAFGAGTTLHDLPKAMTLVLAFC